MGAITIQSGNGSCCLACDFPRFLPLDLPVGTCTHNVRVKGRLKIDAGLSFTCPYSADLSGSPLMLSSLMVIDVGGAEELQQACLVWQKVAGLLHTFPLLLGQIDATRRVACENGSE